MKQKLLVFLAAVLLCVGMLSTSAFADDGYGIYVTKDTDKVEITSTNASDVLGDGTVSYDSSTNTLTLNGADLAAVSVSSGKDLNLELKGTNTIDGARCIDLEGGNLSISGSGTLTATGTSYGIHANGDITIALDTNANVTVTSENTTAIHGKNVSISGGSVNVTANSAGNAILADTALTISNGVTVEAKASNAPALVCDNSNGSIMITDSKVTAESDVGSALYSKGDVNIKNSNIDAKSNESMAIQATSAVDITDNSNVTVSGYYHAIYGPGGVNISGSKVEAESELYYVIYSNTASVSITDSDVTASGAMSAIRGKTAVVISDSELEATSSNGTAISSGADLEITDSVVDASGKEGENGITADGTASVSGSWITTSGTETFENNITDSVLFNGTSGTVIGDATVPLDVTIASDMILYFTEGSSLTIPAGVSFINNGEITGSVSVTSLGTASCGDGCHVGGTATCIAKAVCLVCGEEYGDYGSHVLTKTNAKDAACDEDGYEAYWICSECGKMFSDENGTVEISNPITVSSTGHSYGEPVFTWSEDGKTCTAAFTCADCGDVQTLNCTVTSTVSKAATSTAKGQTTYTAAVTFNGVTYTEKLVLEDISATGNSSADTKTNSSASVQTDDNTKDKSGSTVQTGDDAALLFWVVIVLLAASGITVTVSCTRKRKCGR